MGAIDLSFIANGLARDQEPRHRRPYRPGSAGVTERYHSEIRQSASHVLEMLSVVLGSDPPTRSPPSPGADAPSMAEPNPGRGPIRTARSRCVEPGPRHSTDLARLQSTFRTGTDTARCRSSDADRKGPPRRLTTFPSRCRARRRRGFSIEVCRNCGVCRTEPYGYTEQERTTQGSDRPRRPRSKAQKRGAAEAAPRAKGGRGSLFGHAD